MEFSTFDPSHLGQISRHVEFIIHVESLVVGLNWAAVLYEFATFRHHCEIVVDLLRHLDWFVIKILKVSLSDHCLIRVTFHQMIRGISDLLVVKRKQLVFLIWGVHVGEAGFECLNGSCMDGIALSQWMHTANVSGHILSLLVACSMVMRWSILNRSIQGALMILEGLCVWMLLVGVDRCVMNIWGHLTSFFDCSKPLSDWQLLNFFLGSLGHVDLLLQVPILIEVNLLLIKGFENAHTKFRRFFELSFLASLILFLAPVVPYWFISVFYISDNLSLRVSFLGSVKAYRRVLSGLFLLLFNNILSWHSLEGWCIRFLRWQL